MSFRVLLRRQNAFAITESRGHRKTVFHSFRQPRWIVSLRFAAEAGQHFLRLLDQQPLPPDTRATYRNAFISEFSFQPLTAEQRERLDRESLAFFDLMVARVPDGRRLYAALRSTTPGEIVIALALEIAESDVAEVEKAARL